MRIVLAVDDTKYSEAAAVALARQRITPGTVVKVLLCQPYGPNSDVAAAEKELEEADKVA